MSADPMSLADPMSSLVNDATDDDLLHTVCSACDPDTALCGAKVPGECWTTDGLPCVVCEDLDHYPCPGCGR